MSRKRRRKKVVYILGAGFSYGTGLSVSHGKSPIYIPLQATLWECLTQFNNRQPAKLDTIAKEIRKYFNPRTLRARRKPGYQRHSDLNGISIEEVMTFLYDMMERDNDHPNDTLTNTYDGLLVRTVELIAYLSEHADVTTNELLRLYSNLLINSDTIITFNWDTLLDQILA